MIEELSLINEWLESKDKSFLIKNKIDRSYFFALGDVVDWVDTFAKNNGVLPQVETVMVEFEDFRKVESREPIPYLINALLEQKAYTEYRPVMLKNAKLLEGGNTLDAMFSMRSELDVMLKTYAPPTVAYDWVKNANDRYEEYMKKHGNTGLSGITTGVASLDEFTGGWKADDLILISARLGECKSLVGIYFAYHAWRYVQKAKMNAPIIYYSTEMPHLEIAYRLDTLRKHFSNKLLNEGGLENPDDYREFLEELNKKDASFKIVTPEMFGDRDFTVNDVRAVVESEHPALICVDQLYDFNDGTGEKDIRKKIINVTKGIRDLNLSTLTPTILIAQAGRDAAKNSKKNADATPELHEVQESDSPAQKATRVITLKMISNECIKMSLKKNRSGPKNQDIFLRVDIDNGHWQEVSEEAKEF